MAMWAHLGAMLVQFAHLRARLAQLDGRVCPVLKARWAHLGAMLVHLEAMLAHLGPMLAHLGAMLAHLGDYVGPS